MQSFDNKHHRCECFCLVGFEVSRGLWFLLVGLGFVCLLLLFVVFCGFLFVFFFFPFIKINDQQSFKSCFVKHYYLVTFQQKSHVSKENRNSGFFRNLDFSII